MIFEETPSAHSIAGRLKINILTKDNIKELYPDSGWDVVESAIGIAFNAKGMDLAILKANVRSLCETNEKAGLFYILAVNGDDTAFTKSNIPIKE